MGSMLSLFFARDLTKNFSFAIIWLHAAPSRLLPLAKLLKRKAGLHILCLFSPAALIGHDEAATPARSSLIKS